MDCDVKYYPLTNPQKTMWYTEKLHPNTSIGNIAGTLRIKSNVDYSLLEKAINVFIKKNDSMRLRIIEQDGEPIQYFSEYEYLKIDFFDFSEKNKDELYKWDMQVTKVPFKLIDSNLFYFALVKINDSDGGFYVRCHHLISDAWTMSLLGDQIIDIYYKISSGIDIDEEYNLSYIHHINDEEEYLKSDRFYKDGDYWKSKTDSYPAKTVLKSNDSSFTSTKARRKTKLIPKKLSTKIIKYCKEKRVSVFTLFVSALSMYLYRVKAYEEIILGTTTLNRLNIKDKSITGMFINIVPMWVNINGDMDFDTLTEAVANEGMALLRHQKYPYDLLIREMREKYKLCDNIFDIVLIYQNTKLSKNKSKLDYTTRWHFSGHQNESLRININDRENDEQFIIDYDYLIDIFYVKEIEFIHQNIINILWHALDDTSKKVSRLEMLSEREKHRILYEFKDSHIINTNELTLQVSKIPLLGKRKFYILDKNLNLLPIGIPGELFISFKEAGGEYLKSEAVSEDDIFSNPFAFDDKIYRTGILARWYPDGDIMFIGKVQYDNPGTPDLLKKKAEDINIKVAATFTAEPAGDYIRRWSGEFGYNANIEFAGYNQVFRELLSPVSLLSKNKDGINLLFLRFEDFIRNNYESDELKIIKLEQLSGELEEALRKFTGSVLLVVAIIPCSTQLNTVLRDKIHDLNLKLKDMLSGLRNVFILDLYNLQEMYGIDEVFDALKDKQGHMPFTDEYYAAIGTEAARKIIAIKKQQFKVIVLDCDNTLWKGICGEKGVDGIIVGDNYRELQEFMLQQYNEGMLLAICSKNNEEDVYEVFEKGSGIILKREHFVNFKINWEEKSQNIREMARELNLGLDSFVFIDDNPVECAKMLDSCPEVLTLQLPSDEDRIPLFLQHVWAFDRIKVLKEDLLRSKFYENEKKRKELRETEQSLTNYIENLKLKISMRQIGDNEIDRAVQLTQRTNQFNLNTKRRTEEEIIAITRSENWKCFIIEASDIYGTYGIIGLVILEFNREKVILDTLLLSCRILGRNIEDAVLSGIKRCADESGKKDFEAVFIPSGKNGPVHDFIKRLGWPASEAVEGYIKYALPVGDLPKSADYASFYYNERYESDFDETSKEMLHHTATGCQQDISYKNSVNPHFEGDLINTEILLKTNHSEYILPLQYFSGKRLLTLPAAEVERTNTGDNTTHGNVTEEKLVQMWSSIFKTNHIEIKSSFFELGGDSLNAVILISRIYKAFDVELTLKDIFKYNTICLLAEKIQNSVKGKYTHIKPVEKKDYYELSSAQRRMYLLYQMNKNLTVYNEYQKITIEGRLDINLLEKAFTEFIKRHEVFRTSFEMLDGRPVQKVNEDFEFNITCTDAKEHEIDGIVKNFVQVFDLLKAPLIRAMLIELEKERHILLFDAPHIVIDGTSFSIMVKEILSIYEGKELGPVNIQYKDFAAWQNELLNSEYIIKQKDYWVEQFDDEIPVLNLPFDYTRPAIHSFSGKRAYFKVDKNMSRSLKKICSDTDTTLFMILFASFGLLLQRYSGQEDIVIGTPVSGRSHTDFENVVGMFVNTLPLRTYPSGHQEFLEFLDKVKEAVLLGLENQDYQYESLIEKLGIKRDRSRNPMFDAMFSLQNINMPEIGTKSLKMKPEKVDHGTAKFDISLTAEETKEGIEFELEYCTDLFKDATINRMRVHFLNILKSIASNPKILISEIDILSAQEKDALLFKLNNTQSIYPKEKTIHQMFEEQVEKTPDNIAAIFEDKQMTYRELNAKSNQLARVLRDSGAKPDMIVGIMVERSFEMIIGILGILKAGAAYMPIDPQYPAERIRFMLEDSGTKLLLTQKSFAEKIKIEGEIIYCDDPVIYTASDDNLHNINTSGNLMYVIYTSGSTGKPKGVMLEHRNINNFIDGMKKRIVFNKNDVVLCITTISFDIFVLETWLPLTQGIKIVISTEYQRFDIMELSTTITKNKVSVIQMTPSRMKLILEDSRSDIFLRNLRMILLGGEQLPQPVLESLKSKSNAAIFNMYGPTETAVWSSVKDMTKESVITLGEPISNTEFYILNKYNRIQPANIPGELFIAGDGLARGYINNEILTNQKYIYNNLITQKRMYSTGDLVIMNEEGGIEIIGRLDNQIKMSGYRIELSEIENVMLSYTDITECVVLLNKTPALVEYLCAYFTAKGIVDEYKLNDYLLQKLPFYMIPKNYIQLDEMPLTDNSKVDRKKLKDINVKKNHTGKQQKSEGEIQSSLELIFKKVLNIDIVGVHDNFFELGGDSLQSIRIISEIYNYFEVEVSYSELSASSTIGSLSMLISEKLLEGYKKDIDIGAAYVLLNERKSENIFAFPPITGFGLAFNNMSRYINNYSLYAFNYLEDEDKIEKYYRIIKGIQKEGPYILLGFSAGAHIVMKLAEMISEETIIILMDGFWGEVQKDEIDEKLKFFTKYSMDYANLEGNNKFIKYILEKRIRSYMVYMCEQDKFLSKIDKDIYFIQSEEMTNNRVYSLRRLTSGSFYKHKGFGKHFDLLTIGYVDRNVNVINEIIKTAHIKSYKL